MYPILGRYGPFFLYSYTVALALGLVGAAAVTVWLARQKARPGWVDALLVMVLAGVVGGRLGFVVGQWDYFQQRPSEMIDMWQGGLSYHGALLAGLCALWLWCWWGKRPFLFYAGLFAPGLVLAQAFGWLACYLEGCAFGREVVLDGGLWIRWLTADLPDNFGVFGLRYQTQLLGFVLSLLLFGLVWRLYGRWPPARLFGFTLFALSAIHILLYFGRGDVGQIDLILNIALASLSLVLLQYTKRRYAKVTAM
jgi:phosphatidylglycerol:prolipoprotein diacylglycerol transferase